MKVLSGYCVLYVGRVRLLDHGVTLIQLLALKIQTCHMSNLGIYFTLCIVLNMTIKKALQT